MRHTTEKYMEPCGCRSAGECDHNLKAEERAISACVDEFAAALKAKLIEKMVRDRRAGWDDPDWPRDRIIHALERHIPKGDMIDVAAFAMFAWNQEGGDRA